jgi:hypothetical protein
VVSVEDLAPELESVMVGGNHLANLLIGRLRMKHPDYRTPIGTAQALLSGDDFDLWVCWRSIMLLRDKMEKMGARVW